MRLLPLIVPPLYMYKDIVQYLYNQARFSGKIEISMNG